MSESNLKAVVMDQYVMGATDAAALAAGEVQTPLAHTSDALHASSSTETSSVSLTEAATTGLLVLRAADMASDLSNALESVCSVKLPERLQSTISENGALCIRWMSPDEWLLSCPLADAFEIEKSLRQAIHGHIAIVNVSGGYGVLTLSGTDAINLLKKSTVYDVDAENFPVGKVVNTVFAKAQVTLRAVGQDSYEILVRRSFADYLWLWLQRAGKEYGLKKAIPECH